MSPFKYLFAEVKLIKKGGLILALSLEFQKYAWNINTFTGLFIFCMLIFENKLIWVGKDVNIHI